MVGKSFKPKATTFAEQGSHMLYSVFRKNFQVATSQVHHLEEKNDFIESKNQAANNNRDVKPQKKTQKIDTSRGGSKFFKNDFYENTETQGRREKNRDRKFPQLTTVCQHSHLSYSILESVSGCIPDVHQIEV